MSIVNKDGRKLVKDAGDILSLFGTKAKVEVEITPAEETLAAGHVERIGTALAHVGRGVTVLQELINLAARRPNPQTSLTGLAYAAPPAGPAAEQASGFPTGSQELRVRGAVEIGFDAALEGQLDHEAHRIREGDKPVLTALYDLSKSRLAYRSHAQPAALGVTSPTTIRSSIGPGVR
jgi:hypothetical protein